MNQTSIAIAITVAFFSGLDSIAKAAERTKATYKSADKARIALIPAFAKHGQLKNAVSRDDDGNVTGWNQPNKRRDVKKQANKLNYLLRLAFAPKGRDKGNSKFDAAASAKAFVSKHTAGQTKRYIAELRALV